MAIDAATFDLSMKSPETGTYLTANVYYVDGVTDADGARRPLSIGQLVMALCLQRAADLEDRIVAKMDEMNLVSEQLELMTQIETDVLAGSVNMNNSTLIYNGQSMNYKGFLETVMGMTGVPDTATSDSGDFISALEAKMDEKNSFSQQAMIELQSLTNKRDQCYDMISNVLKTLNTQILANVNNF